MSAVYSSIVSSPLAKVARYASLGAGLVYGYVHLQSLKSQAAKNHESQIYRKREQLIAEAQKKFAAAQPKADGQLITDVEHPQFDLVAVLEHYSKQ
ncbi:hypothetical protein GQ42DRAFT_30180 [Ramicandelaber brevisporus]|nr:hypothetical protein GQ42DRAFT_30180 [Ramicandelaber brevisporus]